jgi:hypothetical protein
VFQIADELAFSQREGGDEAELPIEAPQPSSSLPQTMSAPSHKRKRSLQESTVDLSKLQLAKQRLLALKQDLEDIQETEEELVQIFSHVEALGKILDTSKKIVCNVIK